MNAGKDERAQSPAHRIPATGVPSSGNVIVREGSPLGRTDNRRSDFRSHFHCFRTRIAFQCPKSPPSPRPVITGRSPGTLRHRNLWLCGRFSYDRSAQSKNREFSPHRRRPSSVAQGSPKTRPMGKGRNSRRILRYRNRIDTECLGGAPSSPHNLDYSRFNVDRGHTDHFRVHLAIRAKLDRFGSRRRMVLGRPLVHNLRSRESLSRG